MKAFTKYNHILIIVSIIISVVILAARCMNNPDKGTDIIMNSKGAVFAGSASCSGCHKDISEAHLKTAHHLTSQPAGKNNIAGSFETGTNSYPYDNEHVIVMEQRDTSFYQVEYNNGDEKKAVRFDITIGSGTMGQSYLSWKNEQLFQMPITYFTAAKQWSNSPGYPHKIIFNRPITSRCMECHSTYAKVISDPGVEPEKFAASQMIYGVDCEKCHGPAAEHVAFQAKNPAEKIGRYIINPAKLSRQQNLDLCASCHGGRLKKTKPSFEFTAGDKLGDYFILDTTTPNPNQADVHGNQYGLLRSSKCFRMSDKMTCNTCHNTHQNERGQVAVFSQRCMTCHTTEHNNFCKMADKIGPAIKNNCIDCHMPLKASKAITVQLQENNTAKSALIRSHFISIYKDETKTMLDFINKQQ